MPLTKWHLTGETHQSASLLASSHLSGDSLLSQWTCRYRILSAHKLHQGGDSDSEAKQDPVSGRGHLMAHQLRDLSQSRG